MRQGFRCIPLRTAWCGTAALPLWASIIPVLGGQTADMVCRVLEGTPIADIPVELVNESSVVVNGDTAAALGVDVSRYVQ